MKKMITIFTVMIFTMAMSICSYGQKLGTVRGPKLKWGFVDKNSRKEVIPFKYDDAREFSEGLAAVKLKDKWGFIDEIGEVIIPFNYLDVGKFSEGLARVCSKYENPKEWGLVEIKAWRFIDKIGQEVIRENFNDAGDFSEGLARVKRNKKWGFIDNTGKAIISFNYDDANDFSEGTARVKIKRNWIYIDNTGTEVYKDIFAEIQQEVMSEFKNCPYCGEDILAVATKCKHCGEWLDKTATSKVPFKPKKGSFCLEVQFKPLGDIVIQSNPNSIGLGSAGVSAKCFVAKKSELRIDLLFGHSKDKEKTPVPPDNSEGKEKITTNTTTAFGLNFGMNRHFNGTERISPYIGFLLGFGVGKTEAKIDNLDFISGNYSSMKIKTSGINFMIPTGFNWYIVNGLYIGAEVGLGLSFEKEFIEIEISINGKKITTNPTASLFGISFYAAPAIRLGWKF